MSTQSEELARVLAAFLDGRTDDVAALRRDVDALQAGLANVDLGRFQILEQAHITAMASIQELRLRIAAFPGAGAAQVNGWQEQFDTLTGVVNSSHTELLGEIQTLKAQMTVVNTRLGEHDVAIGTNTTEIASLVAAIGSVNTHLQTEIGERRHVGEQAANAHSRIDNLRFVFNWVGFLIGAGVMLMANFIWSESFESWHGKWNAFHWILSCVAVGFIVAAVGTKIIGTVDPHTPAWNRFIPGRRAALTAPTPPEAPTPPVPAPQPAPAQN
jgi:hypothetical protein